MGRQQMAELKSLREVNAYLNRIFADLSLGHRTLQKRAEI